MSFIQEPLRKRLSKSWGSETTGAHADYLPLVKLSLELGTQHKTKGGILAARELQRKIFLILETPELVEIANTCLEQAKNQTNENSQAILNPVISAVTKRCAASGSAAKTAHNAVMLDFIPSVCNIIANGSKYEANIVEESIICLHRITKTFGARDPNKILPAAEILVKSGLGALGRLSLASDALATMVDILGEQMMSLIPSILTTVNKALGVMFTSDAFDERLHNASLALFKAITDKIPLAMTGSNLDCAINLVAKSIKISPEKGTKARQNLSWAIASRVDSTDVFKALTIPLKQFSEDGDFESLLVLTRIAIKCAQTQDITGHQKVIFAFILEALKLRARYAHSLATTDAEHTEYTKKATEVIEDHVLDLLKMTLPKSTAETFGPFFVRAMEFAAEPRGEKEAIAAHLTAARIINASLDKLQELFMQFMPLALPLIIGTLDRKWDMAEPTEVDLLMGVTTVLVKSCNIGEYWYAPANFDAVASRLVRLLPLSMTHVSPAVVALASGAGQQQLATINGQILVLLRSSETEDREAGAKAQEKLTEELGDEWLHLLPEMYPIMSELFEDPEENVVSAVWAWKKAAEGKMGMQLDEMLQ
jgi:U3 small nucleolar RNA-associated protein 10